MEENKSAVSRRSFLVNGTAAMGALGLALGVGTGSLINPSDAHAATLTFPQPPALDVDKVRWLGFYWYKKGPGCGHGSARALIQGFSEACTAANIDPAGWDQLPRGLYGWCNGGGPAGWGALCGAIAGSVGVMNLIGRQGDIGQAVFEYYVSNPFPGDFKDFPATFDGGVGTLPALALPRPYEASHAVVTDSPLCHVSVSKWMAAAGVEHGQMDLQGRDIRSDRCAKVTAETAAKTAELYNLYKSGTAPAWTKPAAMAGCYDCHDTNNTTLGAANDPPLSNRSSQTKMDCLPCHTAPKSGRK